MGVSALRVTACAGVLVAGLILGDSGTGLALADPGSHEFDRLHEQLSKGVKNLKDGLAHAHRRHPVGHRKQSHGDVAQGTPSAKTGSQEESAYAATESTVVTESTMATLSDEGAPAPEVAPDPDRQVSPDGSDVGGIGTEGTDPGVDLQAAPEAAPVDPTDTGGDGSDYSDTAADNVDNVDNTVVSDQVVAQVTPIGVVEYPYPFYLLEIRRDGGTWWNANQIIARFTNVIGNALMPAPPTPEPAPAIVTAPMPAFRGPAPEAPAPEPEPVLDALGGAGGGSDYAPTDFGGAPVLQAPIFAIPVPPAGSAVFPAAAPFAAPGAGTGLAATPRVVGTEPGATTTGIRSGGTQEQTPTSTVNSMSAQAPRQGFTEYLRNPGLPQLAGAALPGVAGILLLTCGGGVIGYRQASAGRMVRMSGAARYLP